MAKLIRRISLILTCVIFGFSFIYFAIYFATDYPNKDRSINIHTTEWKKTKKEIMKKYPKIKRIEFIGETYAYVYIPTNREIDKEDAEKIFEKMRKLIFSRDMYNVIQETNYDKNYHYAVEIDVIFYDFKSDHNYFQARPYPDGLKGTREMHLLDNRCKLPYEYYNSWEITYKGKEYDKKIPVKK